MTKQSLTSSTSVAVLLVFLAAFIGTGHVSDAFAPPMATIRSFGTARNLILPNHRDTGNVNSDKSEKGSFSILPFQSSIFPGDYVISRTDAETEEDWIPGADNGWPNFFAASIFTASTVAVIYIIYIFRDMIMNAEPTVGFVSLLFVTVTLIWDKFVISLGSACFRDVETNATKYQILKLLSFPRFIFHAIGAPLQCITIAEMGKYAGLGCLQSDLVQAAFVVGAIAVAIEDSTDFIQTNSLKLTMWEESPPNALERDLVKFTYKDLKFRYIIPVIVLSFVTLGVGIVTLISTSSGNAELADWLIFSALTSLVGNSLSQATFTGNIGEVCMQFGLLEAARIVYYH